MTPSESLLRQLSASKTELPPEGIVSRTMKRLEDELARRRRHRRFVFGRLTLAAIVSTPVVFAVTVTEILLFYATLSRYLPTAAASALSSVVGGSMLLTLALAYGSLPILASLGLKLREEARST